MVNDYKQFQDYLVQCRSVLVLIGSGLSALSGLDTFENSAGYWRNFHSIDLSTPDAFLDDPGLVWQFYNWRRQQALDSRPNRGHFALAEFSRRFKRNCLSISLNVDGLNHRAGQDKLLELHGNLFSLKCTDFFCNYSERDNFDYDLLPSILGKDREVILGVSKDQLPRCGKCGGLLRPGVTWFGESIPLKLIDTVDDFLIHNKVDLIIVVGTSGKVWPAVGYVERVKLQGGKIAVFNREINQDEVAKDNVWGFEGDAMETLPRALEVVIGEKYMPRDYQRR